MTPRMDRAAQRAVLLKLGAAVAEEMRNGQGGEAADAIGDAIAAMPRATLEIVGLIGREARRRRPDAHLVAALAFICGQALESLRYGVERQDPQASATLDALRGRLVQEARSETADPAVLMLLTKQFAAAKLDIGAELRDAMGDMLDEQSADAAEAAQGDADMERHLADLARELGEDPFAIHGELAETASSFPVDHRLAMASFMLASDALAVREAALGWLFDPEPGVATALCGSLRDEAAAGRLDGTSLRRLVAVRNWLPAAVRPEVDAAVRAARRRGGEPAPLPAPQIEELRVSGFDGSGAVSVFALVKLGGRFAVASLLFKLGYGLRDAWVQHSVTRAEARAQIERVTSQIDLVPLSATTLRRLLAHMLAVNSAGAPPPFAAIDVVEALGFGVVNPASVAPEEVVALASDASEDGATRDRGDCLDASGSWPARYGFMDSWFEDDAAVDGVLAGRKGLSRSRRADLVLEQVVKPHRRRWGEMLAWTALITADAASGEEAGSFALVAAALLGDAPASEVPLLRAIAEATVEARRSRRAREPAGR